MDMRQREITIPGITLPEDCRILDYCGDLLLIGKDLNLTRFNKIKAELPSEFQQRLIGWRLVPGLMTGGLMPWVTQP